MARDLLLPSETAERLLVDLRTLATWRYRGVGPPYIKVVGGVRYRLSDVEAYLAEREVRAGGDAA